MQIERLPSSVHSLWVQRYLGEDKTIQSFYSYSPFRRESYVERAQELKERSFRRAGIAKVLRQFHSPELISPTIQQNLERLCLPNSLVVVGGQQAGLLTGPLYTIYKAVTVIQLAKREEIRLNRPVIPLFWIAGEDHDWAEVNHVWVGGERGPTKCGFPFSPFPGQLVSKIKVQEESMHAWLEKLARLLPDSLYKKEWLEILKEQSTGEISWTRFFARILFYLFGKDGLLLLDSADPNLRHLEIPYWERLIENNEAIQRQVQQGVEEIEKQGYESPIHIQPHQAHLFVELKGKRCLLFREDHEEEGRKKGKGNGTRTSIPTPIPTHFYVKGASNRWGTQELLALSSSSPEILSNNVVTRPLMQEWILPVLAFVAGPGEIAYWGILKGVFNEMGLEMPIVFPRSHLLLLEPGVKRRLEQLGLSWEEWIKGGDTKKEEWLESQYPFDLKTPFQMANESMLQAHSSLITELEKGMGMRLQGIGETNWRYIEAQMHFLYKEIRKMMETRHQVDLRQLEEIRHALCPNDGLQERVYNLLHYWNRYGLGWLDLVFDAIHSDIFRIAP